MTAVAPGLLSSGAIGTAPLDAVAPGIGAVATAADAAALDNSFGFVANRRSSTNKHAAAFAGLNDFPLALTAAAATTPPWGFYPERATDRPQWRSSNRRAGALAGYTQAFVPDLPVASGILIDEDGNIVLVDEGSGDVLVDEVVAFAARATSQAQLRASVIPNLYFSARITAMSRLRAEAQGGGFFSAHIHGASWLRIAPEESSLRVDGLVRETLLSEPSEVSVGGVDRETLIANAEADLLVSGSVRETLVSTDTASIDTYIRIGGVLREVVVSTDNASADTNIRIGAVVRETLASTDDANAETHIRVAAMVRETLISTNAGVLTFGARIAGQLKMRSQPLTAHPFDVRVTAATHLRTPVTLQVHFGATLRAGLAITAGAANNSPANRALTDADPLWVALEVDLWDTVAPENPDGTTTLLLSNRGPLTRVINGELRQYLPRLIVPITVSNNLTIFSGDQFGGGTMFQQPLRTGNNSTTISWAIDPDFADYLQPSRFHWIGRVWRLYEGRTATDIGVDVDADLALVYTGNVTGLAYTLDGSPTATMQCTDASSSLDKSLVDDFYPADFPIESLRGKPRPQLWGRRVSIVPVLEDEANLIYRVSRTPLDDVTELRVGGVPWRRSFVVPGPIPPSTYEITQAAGPGYLMYYPDANDIAYWVAVPGATIVAGAGLPAVPAGTALYTIVQQTGPSYIGALDLADINYWVSNGAVVSPYIGAAPPPSLFGSPGASTVGGPQQGEWFADLANGTVQLGSVTGGAEVRVDAQAVGWQTLDTAALITEICVLRGIAVDAVSMAQLHLDWAGLIGFRTGAEAVNCLDALDRITLANLCWWDFGPDAAVVAGAIDAPEIGIPDFVVFGSDPGVPLDLSLFPAVTVDPIPKELEAIGQSQLIPPAWRFRVEYEEHESPETSVLGGATDEEKAHWGSPGLVRDWSPGDAGFDLTPADGIAIRLAEPRAQDIYLKSLAWREAEAIALRTRAVQRILGNLPRETFPIAVRMPSTQPRPFQLVAIVWVADNARSRELHGGLFRIVGITRSSGGGAQQLTLWGSGGSALSARSDAPTPITIPVPAPSTPPALPPPTLPPPAVPPPPGTPPTGTTPTPVLSIVPPAPVIFDTTPLGTVVATIMVYMSDSSAYTGVPPIFAAPDFDDGGRFIITGPSSGAGPYSLVLNPAGPGLPSSLSIEHTTIVVP